jgi:hypothetical protein
MTGHRWQAEGVDPASPGPQWANRYTLEQIRSVAHFALEYQRRNDGLLGAFWPLEWRLVAQWAAAVAQIHSFAMAEHQHARRGMMGWQGAEDFLLHAMSPSDTD